MITYLLIAIILSLIFIIVRITKGGILALLFKVLSSISFVVLAIFLLAKKDEFSLSSFFITCALLFGLFGDTMLDLKIIYPNDKKIYLYSGFISFSICHILCSIGMINLISSKLWIYIVFASVLGIIMGIIFLILSKLQKLNIKGYKIISLIYAFFLAFDLGLSMISFYNEIIPHIMTIGMFLFLTSDLVLSNIYFGTKENNKVFNALNLGLYYSAQILIASSILYI